LHIGPLVPAGEKVDKYRYYQQHSQRQAYSELSETTFAAKPVSLPVLHKSFFFFCKHSSAKIKQGVHPIATASQNIYLVQLIPMF
jgi:hypothetical protein